MTCDDEGRLPLHWATNNDNPEVISILLKYTPTLNIKYVFMFGLRFLLVHHHTAYSCIDKAGMTPLMWACYNNAPKSIKRLLKYGAELDEKDMDGKTAMHWVKDTAMVQVPCCHLTHLGYPCSIHHVFEDGFDP
jgi:ankyrin repeat protein